MARRRGNLSLTVCAYANLMSEQDPLLSPSAPHSPDINAYLEAQESPPESTYRRVKKRTAEILESTPLHYTVITLVRPPPFRRVAVGPSLASLKLSPERTQVL